MTQLEDSTFEQEVAQGVAVIDFWAPWCGPCKTVAPMFEAIGSTYEGTDVKFLKADVDVCQELRTKFSIRNVPTFIVLKDGVEVGRHVGPANLTATLSALIEKSKQ